MNDKVCAPESFGKTLQGVAVDEDGRAIGGYVIHGVPLVSKEDAGSFA